MKTTVMLLLSDWATLSKGPVSNFPSVLLALLLWLLLTWCGEAGDERLTDPCSFSALRLRFESKGKAGNAVFLLSPCFSVFSPPVFFLFVFFVSFLVGFSFFPPGFAPQNPPVFFSGSWLPRPWFFWLLACSSPPMVFGLISFPVFSLFFSSSSVYFCLCFSPSTPSCRKLKCFARLSFI
ncbi:hypothetical protein NC652_034372 [Populus alba x Populus x berolinensis]|nr:hypothetical protein NC652_034372 [Populus alba x Populus x berolinensis]